MEVEQLRCGQAGEFTGRLASTIVREPLLLPGDIIGPDPQHTLGLFPFRSQRRARLGTNGQNLGQRLSQAATTFGGSRRPCSLVRPYSSFLVLSFICLVS